MNTFGTILKTTIFGGSHTETLGVVMDGVPSGLELRTESFAADIERRAPGNGEFGVFTTPRHDNDIVEITSGLFNGITTGEALSLVFRNENVRDTDYARFADIPRPGHADHVAAVRYGEFNDPRGGGQFSGRMTLPLVAAGVVAKKIIPDISFRAELVEIGGSSDRSEWESLLGQARYEGDSLGGIVRCEIDGMPIGEGEPFFDSMESLLSHAVFSIPGVRGIEFGDGFRAAAMKGSEHNDPWTSQGPAKNGAGGINGGLTTGAPVVFRTAFKPTSSITRPQQTWNFRKRCMDTLEVKGRHDVCFALRTPVIVEAMAALVIADLSLQH